MAAVSLLWDTNMAAVTSCENTLLLNWSYVFRLFLRDRVLKNLHSETVHERIHHRIYQIHGIHEPKHKRCKASLTKFSR